MPLVDIPLSEHPDKGAGARCCKCHLARLYANDFDARANPTAAEAFAYLCQVADAQGWGYGTDIIDGAKTGVFVCPACLKRDAEAMERTLPLYDEIGRCPKCGHGKLGTRFCHGRVTTCGLGAVRDHLHRICRRCSYSWIEGCLDDPKTERQEAHGVQDSADKRSLARQ